MTKSEDTLNKQFELSELYEADLDPNPIEQFRIWYGQALGADFIYPNAFTLATSTKDGKPSARQLLLKDFDEEGFVFYSNSESKKGSDLADNPFATLCFWWDKLERQVRVEGKVQIVSQKDADEYFHSRPIGSQLGAWASNQSTVIPDRELLDNRYREFEKKFEDKIIPRPPYWNGYRLVPVAIEFWQGRQNRLHDRLRYKLQKDGSWTIERLAP
ncbi:MAG: pyridoxine/pyridoxamine 5'-phosphate oxidase [Thermodesulfobacteriota bacterium]|nr:MAG: pyridoxine/pyridoxamine 5'-phosphate oxidase [Thermodesulfobacteriota bacterium]